MRLRISPAMLVRATLIAVGASPLLFLLFARVPFAAPITEALDAWFAFHCHREPARSLSWFGGLPVCVRCFGIYAGFLAGALCLRPTLRALALSVWVGSALLVMALDVATETLHMRPPFAPLRWLSGFALAYPVAAALVQSLRGASRVRTQPTTPG